MTSVQKFLSSWHKLISDGQIETAYEQLKSEIAEQKWTIDQENKMANYCLVCTNMKAYEFLKNKVKDRSTAQRIFRMTDFCCRIIGKTWKCKVTDFMGCLRVIGEYFLASDNVYEALVISQYRMEFVHIHNERESFKNENSKITDDMVLFYLHHLHKMPMNDLQAILDIWKYILSPKVIEVTSSNISSILLSLGNFCSKANSTEGVQSSLLIMWYLSELPLANFTEKDIDTFVNICEIIIRYSNTDKLKRNISKLICCIERIMLLYRSGELLAIPFCCDVLRFSVCRCDSSDPSILVDNCYKGLNAVQSASSMLQQRAANFARTVLIHAQNYWLDGENFFYRKCSPNVFTFFITLAEILKRIEINQNNTNERKYSSVLSLAILITNRITDLSKEELISISLHVKKCLSMLLEIYDDDCEVDNAFKTQLFNSIGVHSFNIVCLYMKAKLHFECEEVSLMATEKISAVSNDLVLKCSLQSYVEKMSICLYHSQKYDTALRTTCIWAAKLPQSRTTFMSRYATFKAKIFYEENRDSYIELVNKTCWDMIKEDQQKNSSVWEKINLTDRNIMDLLKLELKHCLTHQIHSVDLLEKIIEQGALRNDITKIELFILGGLIFTQSSDFLSNAIKLLPIVENNIKKLDQKMIKKDFKGNVVHYSTIVGSLHYVKFRIKLLSARCENEKEVALTSSMKSLPPEPGMEQEVRDDSDIMHKHLYYKSQLEFISLLDAAVDHWSRAINEVTNEMGLRLCEKNSEIREDIDIQTLVKETALMYRLYCAESKEIRAWKLLYSLAVIREDDETMVYALSNLISLNAPVDPEWETKVEEKLSTVDKITRTNYQLERIRKLFINGQGNEGVTILSQISEEDTNGSVHAAKYNFVMSQYTLAGFFKVSDYPLSTAMRAFYLLIPYIKRSSWRSLWEASEIQSLLLDVTSFILQFHVSAFQTNFVKTYLDKAVYLIKKLGLPLRICKVLTILCTIGVITCKTEDVYVKLNSLKSVLKFDEGVKEEDYDKERRVKTAATLSPTNFSSNTDVRFVSNFGDNYASPILETGLKYDTPEFVNHESQCECAICDDVQYQQVSCEVMSLIGSYMWLLGSPHCGHALSHFDNALKMCSRLRDRWKDSDPVKENFFLKTQIITKMRLADFWASNEKFEDAWKLNKEAVQEYENLIIPDAALRSQLIDQCFALEYIKLKAESPKKELTRKKLNFGSTATKTPKCKTTVTVFEDEREPSRLSELLENMAITPLPKNCRKLLFKEPPTSSRTTRNRNKKDVNTPPDIVMQTPSSLRSKKRTILEGRFPSSSMLQNDAGLFSSPSEPTVSNRRTRTGSKTRERLLDSVEQTSSSRRPIRSKKPLKDEVTSSVDENNDTPSTIDGKPVASNSSTSTLKSEKKYPALGVVKQIPSSSRTRSRKTAENTVSSSTAESTSRQKKRKN